LFLNVRDPIREADARLTPTVVLVLGMHRSGTSSTAGTLVRLGAAAPLHLMAPGPDNERGFWESPVIVDLNDAILAAGGSNWRDWRKFSPEQMDGAVADALRARAKAARIDEFIGASLLVIKDPRMCRLMPFWAPVFAEAEWSVCALLPIRSPLEVVWSLNCRDGISPGYGCLLWLRHVLGAEAETRGVTRAFLDWPQFLGEGREPLAGVTEQFGLIWPHGDEDALAEVDEFLSADLRHQRASDDDLRVHPAVSDMVRETYAAMVGLVQDPGDSRVLRRLDDLRAGFERASAIFDSPMRELNEDLRRTHLQAAAEIARAERMIAHIANRDSDQRCGSTRARFLSFWNRPPTEAVPRMGSAKDLVAIRNSLFFNATHYLEKNRDVRAAGVDAAFHYLVHGGREGRDPGPFFSTKAYLARYPDVLEAGLNALLHYETLGRRENRIVVA
jgi:hypothetical protein